MGIFDRLSGLVDGAEQSSSQNKSLHEEWVQTDPEKRGKHPVVELKESQGLSKGDTCVLENCNATWERTTASISSSESESLTGEVSGSAIVGGTVSGGSSSGKSVSMKVDVLSCSDPQCPCSMNDPQKMSEFIEKNREGRKAKAPNVRNEIEQHIHTNGRGQAEVKNQGTRDNPPAKSATDERSPTDRSQTDGRSNGTTKPGEDRPTVSALANNEHGRASKEIEPSRDGPNSGEPGHEVSKAQEADHERDDTSLASNLTQKDTDQSEETTREPTR